MIRDWESYKWLEKNLNDWHLQEYDREYQEGLIKGDLLQRRGYGGKYYYEFDQNPAPFGYSQDIGTPHDWRDDFRAVYTIGSQTPMFVRTRHTPVTLQTGDTIDYTYTAQIND